MLDTYSQDETGGHGGDIAAALRLWQPDGQELVDFSSNINPLGPPPGLIEHLKEHLAGMVAYPTPQARDLRHKLSEYFNLPAEQILLGNGATELIHLLMLWRRPPRVFVPAPAFSEYERAARLSGAEVIEYPLPPGKSLDTRKIKASLQRGDMLVFCNPNNPTGSIYERKDLLELVDQAAELGAEVMIDESFIPLTGRPEQSLALSRQNNLWVIVSLTKIWGLPGLRVGFMSGPTEAISEISQWGDPWRVNFLAQLAGLYCLNRHDYIEESLKLIKNERKFLSRRFMEMGQFKVFEGSANYLLLKALDPTFRVEKFQIDLARRGVLIRRADNFSGLNHLYLRIAVKQRADNLRLVQETERWFNLNRGEERCKS